MKSSLLLVLCWMMIIRNDDATSSSVEKMDFFGGFMSAEWDYEQSPDPTNQRGTSLRRMKRQRDFDCFDRFFLYPMFEVILILSIVC